MLRRFTLLLIMGILLLAAFANAQLAEAVPASATDASVASTA